MQRREWVKTAAAGALGALHLPPGAAGPEGPQSEDVIVVEGLVAGTLRLSHLRGQQQGGVHAGVASCPGDFGSYARELKFFDRYRTEVIPARSVADIRQARRDGRVAHIYGWQSAETLGSQFNGTMGNTDTALRAYREIGLRICGICYNVANLFGGGCLEPHLPLTRAGRRLVEEIHGLGIVLDVGGHTGQQTSLDAIALSSGVPVICSHTNVAAIADNPRCISDRLIRAIAGTGGVVGLTAVNDFHVRSRKDAAVPQSPRVTVEAYLDQFDHIKRLVGVDHVGLGPDFVDGMPLDYNAVNREIITRDMISDGPWRYVQGFESIAELPNVMQGLRRRGWSEVEVRKAMGGNWLRVYQRVWKA
ncbi:MAG TPA: membrane dipeptidase [Gemmatimonadales bacterium]